MCGVGMGRVCESKVSKTTQRGRGEVRVLDLCNSPDPSLGNLDESHTVESSGVSIPGEPHLLLLSKQVQEEGVGRTMSTRPRPGRLPLSLYRPPPLTSPWLCTLVSL